MIQVQYIYFDYTFSRKENVCLVNCNANHVFYNVIRMEITKLVCAISMKVLGAYVGPKMVLKGF